MMAKIMLMANCVFKFKICLTDLQSKNGLINVKGAKG